MKRNSIFPRNEWQKKVESQGLLFHTAEETVIDCEPVSYREPAKFHTEQVKSTYWDETAYYEFTSKQIDELESATNELHKLCLDAVENVISNERYDELKIPTNARDLIKHSWNMETPAIYGRMDLSYDGVNAPKLLEYNADTPTSLLEASVIQWYWLEECFKNCDQFNSIHEKLIAHWKEIRHYLHDDRTLHFTYMEGLEDYMNVSYLRDTAKQAKINTKELEIEEIGWNGLRFVDDDDKIISNIFKLYPWEWMLKDEFSANIAKSLHSTHWIEPAWKMILSNKGILPILWELNPGHPNLLAATTNENSDLLKSNHVKKPFYSREGANVTIQSGMMLHSTGGAYGEEGYIYQEYAPLPNFDGNYPVIGSWVIDGESAGIGIRESKSLITDNLSRFVPHLFR